MDKNPKLSAKLRQVARLVADELATTPQEEREDWLTLKYPGGKEAGRALLVEALHDKQVQPSRGLLLICKSMWGITRPSPRRNYGKEEEEP